LQAKILFWLAVAMGAAGMLSPEGNLYYFLAVHSSMLMIGCSLHRREKRGRNAAAVKTAPPKSTVTTPKTKAA
jgi:hypothetical protein